MPKIKTKKSGLERHELEYYEPGTTREAVLQALKKVATSPKACQKKHAEQPDSASS